MNCFFVSDLHGKIDRYEKLFNLIFEKRPDIVFWGGDLLPSFTYKISSNDIFDKFIEDYLLVNLLSLKTELGNNYPEMLMILGNDDLKTEEEKLVASQEAVGVALITALISGFSARKSFEYGGNEYQERESVTVYSWSDCSKIF
jgi:Icc-related predicted phosphoesterase